MLRSRTAAQFASQKPESLIISLKNRKLEDFQERKKAEDRAELEKVSVLGFQNNVQTIF